MPKIQYFLTADYALQEAETNKYSLIGIFDNFNIPPGLDSITVPNFVIYTKIVDTKNTELVEFIINKNNGDELNRIEIKTPPTKHESLNVAAVVQNLVLNEPGEYSVQIKINGELVPSVQNQYLKVVKL